MQRKSSEPLYKTALNVFASDYQWLRDKFPTIGPHVAIRNIIRQFRQNTDAKIAQADLPSVDELELNDE